MKNVLEARKNMPLGMMNSAPDIGENAIVDMLSEVVISHR